LRSPSRRPPALGSQRTPSCVYEECRDQSGEDHKGKGERHPEPYVIENGAPNAAMQRPKSVIVDPFDEGEQVQLHGGYPRVSM
jgi:hypothetical protein